MTIPNLRFPRLTNSGTRGAGVSRGTPGYQPRHAAPTDDTNTAVEAAEFDEATADLGGGEGPRLAGEWTS